MIGVDIGGTNLLVGIVENGKVLERIHQPIVAKGNFEAVVKQTCDVIKTLAGESIDTVGISVAGSVDANNGIVLRAQNLNWDNVPLASSVSSILQCSVIIENDVSSAAWGEFKYGAGIKSNSMFAVWIGTGIGGGLILNSELWRGPLGTGGEFGMGISEVDSSAPIRVLEGFASRSGLQQLLQLPKLDTAMILSTYGQDESITEAVNAGARRIGTAIANVITLLSLDTVILGGGIVESLGEDYLNVIRKQFYADVFPAHCKQCKLYATKLGPDAGILGAASIAHK